MIEWKHLTSDEIPALDRRLPVIIPVGLIEAHGPHLALSVDLDSAEYFSRRVAEATGAILAPALPYGFADEMAEYPGTIGLTGDTTIAVLTDLARHFCRHGFKNLLFLSGHGANGAAFNLAVYRVWETYPDARLAYWNYWSEAGFTKISHADQAETEIALAIGTRSHMDRVKDFKVSKPWYRIRSRAAICPGTGGINGSPSQADPAEGERVCAEIVRILSEKVRAIIAAEQAAPPAK
jgi:creatinine amidohydrolase